MEQWKDLYMPSEPRNEEELKDWIMAFRKRDGDITKRIMSKDYTNIKEIHDVRENSLLRGGYTGAGLNQKAGHSGAIIYWWVGFKDSRKMYRVGYIYD
ncbi:hypothetical protein KAU33_15650 [Candidatus Dependentiae bacterium]|nr:hypothetical protein [Candidatus Dependentiae bacterium]